MAVRYDYGFGEGIGFGQFMHWASEHPLSARQINGALEGLVSFADYMCRFNIGLTPENFKYFIDLLENYATFWSHPGEFNRLSIRFANLFEGVSHSSEYYTRQCALHLDLLGFVLYRTARELLYSEGQSGVAHIQPVVTLLSWLHQFWGLSQNLYVQYLRQLELDANSLNFSIRNLINA